MGRKIGTFVASLVIALGGHTAVAGDAPSLLINPGTPVTLTDEPAATTPPADTAQGAHADQPAPSPAESQVQSEPASGFTPPAATATALPAFGLAAKMKVDAPSFESPAAPAFAAVYAFAGAIGMGILATLAVCLLLARTTDARGESRRALTLGAKLSGGFGLQVCAMLLACTVGAVSIRDLAAANAESADVTGDLRLASELSSQASQSRVYARRLQGTVNPKNLELYTRAITLSRELAVRAAEGIHVPGLDTHAKEAMAAIDAYDASVASVVDATSGLAHTEDALLRPAMAAVRQAVDALEAGRSQDLGRAALVLTTLERTRADQAAPATARAAADRVQALCADLAPRNPALAGAAGFAAQRLCDLAALREARDNAVKNGLEVHGPKIAESIDKLAAGLAPLTQEISERSAGVYTAAVFKLAGVCALAVIASCMVGGSLVRSINGASRAVLGVLGSVARGDLTVRPINSTAGDELGELSRATDAMAATLRDLISEVSVATTEVSGAATQIAASAEQMSASITEVARQASQASASAESSGQIARSGGEVVVRTVDGMAQIDNAVSASATSVQELGRRSGEIGQVVAVIKDIADQTNLLALNAAIEAARAGEHGRGFAVVADEVRKLAERTAKATDEVTVSIQSIQTETTQAVERMASGTEQVKAGVQLAQQAGDNLRQIVDNTSQVAQMIVSITTAAQEAGAGAGQSAAAAAELSSKSEQLMTMLGRFRVDAGAAR